MIRRVTKLTDVKMPDGIMVLDIECVKERVANWVHPFRFRTVMIGFVKGNEAIQLASNNLDELISAALAELSDFQIFVFEATRDFDIEVLRGRWTSARKAFANGPGPWATIDLSNRAVNMRREFTKKGLMVSMVDRTEDIASVACIAHWLKGDREPVFRHNLLDLIETSRRYLAFERSER